MARINHHDHWHVVFTEAGCVLPDSIYAVRSLMDAVAMVADERRVQRDTLAPYERIESDRNKLGFAVETDTVGRYRSVVYTEGCDDTACDLLHDARY